MLELWQAEIADVYIKRHFPNLPSSAELIHDVDLNLVHTNFFVDYPKLVAPNTKYVGGMNLGEGRPLEGKLREFVDGAEKGVEVHQGVVHLAAVCGVVAHLEP